MRIGPETRLVLNALFTRRDNYGVTSIKHYSGRYYDVTIAGRDYIAVVLPASFDFWTLRYHLAEVQPDICICLKHDSVLPIPCLHLDSSNMCEPYGVPEAIGSLKSKRWSKSGAQCLVSLYLLGVHSWVDYIESLPATTRKRYVARARDLAKRPVKGGRPVGLSTKV